MRIMGLDIGDVRIGVSLSDPSGTIAQPLVVIKHRSKWEDVKKIRDLIEEHQVKKVIVGLPINMNHSEGPRVKKTKKFVQALVHDYPLDIEYVDERMTTIMATDVLIKGNVRREDRKDHVDKVAAAVILQSYLDREGFR